MIGKFREGFTLIEVLVASVILFAAIATATMVYSSATLSSKKAEIAIVLSGYVPFMVENIEQQLLEMDSGTQISLQGKGTVMQTSYSWRARIIQSRAAMPRIDGISGTLVEQTPRYHLWQVELTAKYGGSEKIYRYKELTY